MGKTAIGIVLAACLLAQARTALACESDTECRGDRVCQKGECVDPNAGKAPAVAPDAPPPAHPDSPGPSEPRVEPRERLDEPNVGRTPNAHGGVYLGALGFLQFGPTLALEFGGGGKGASVAFFVRGRAMNLGPLPYILALTTKDKFTLGWGAAAGLRIYVSQMGSFRGFYVGGAAEYISWDSEENDGKHEDVTIKYKVRFVGPQAELGYRWIFGKNFSFAVGGNLGYLIVLNQDTEYDLGSSDTTVDHLKEQEYEAKTNNRVFGSLNLELGFIF
jgi:hypothetical protein